MRQLVPMLFYALALSSFGRHTYNGVSVYLRDVPILRALRYVIPYVREQLTRRFASLTRVITSRSTNDFTCDYSVKLRDGISGREMDGCNNTAGFKEYMSSRIANSEMRVAHNCIEGNNCAGVNRIFITPRAIRESSTGQYRAGEKERRTGIELRDFHSANTKVFISALGHGVVAQVFVNLIEVPGECAKWQTVLARGECSYVFHVRL